MPKFLVQISDDCAPEDGDAFDTLIAVLTYGSSKKRVSAFYD